MSPMLDDELLECKALQEEEYEVIEVSRKLSIIVPLMTSSKTVHLSWLLVEQCYRRCVKTGDTS